MIQVFSLVSPFYIQKVVDGVLVNNNTQLLNALAIGFFLLLVFEVGVSYFRQIFIVIFSSKLNIQISNNVFRHLIRLPMDYFSKRHVGDILSRFQSLSEIRELFTVGLIDVFIDGLLASFTLVAMYLYSPSLTIVVIFSVCIYGAVRLVFFNQVKMNTEEWIIASAKENTHFMETLRSMRTIKLYQKEDDRQKQWLDRLVSSMNKDIQIKRWKVRFDSTNIALFGAENILVIYLAALMVINGELTVGMLFAFIAYKTRFVTSIDKLIVKLMDFKMLNLHFDRLSDVVYTKQDPSMDLEKSDVFNTGQSCLLKKHIECKSSLVIKGLTYSYSKLEPPVFENINLDIAAGTTVAIIGESGVGKSTFLSCLMGLTVPDKGTIYRDGKNIFSDSLYRKEIAGILQDDSLLSGSIFDNITCFESKPDKAKVVSCAKKACIHDDITLMPMNYNTLIGDMGSSLSGGQKQRIILARALYRNPHILFMDEATSHLDVKNEITINRKAMFPLTVVECEIACFH